MKKKSNLFHTNPCVGPCQSAKRTDDVAIAGAGYTGLWTAYALKRADPTLRVVVCEREIAGFGASGRNGGWCSALFAGSRAVTARRRDCIDVQRTSGCNCEVDVLPTATCPLISEA